LPFPGSDSDSRGFALYRNNWQLEDNNTWAKVLETHHQWISDGWIMGVYPQVTVPSNAQLKVTMGFFKGATGSDGVTFEVEFQEFLGLQVAPKIYSILSHTATYDGKLDTLTEELNSVEGKTGNFVLYAKAGQSSGQDWAAWAEAKIEIAAPAELPDLIVSRIECGPGNKLSVTIKNIGSGALPDGWAAVAETYFDDEKKGSSDLTSPTSTSNEGIEKAGGSSTYLLAWDITAQVTVRVMVDSTNDITESNEQNNSKEEEIEPLVTELPDLVIEEIMCDQGNSQIGYVIKNIGEETATGGHSATLSVDGKEVAHDLVSIDLQPGATHESWFKEYKWQCKTIKVKVCADNYSQVSESNEQNNCRESTCECLADVTPPRIISGPTVSEVTQTSARVCWETDEESDSLLRYDSRSGKFETIIEDTNLVTEHCLDLLNLEPGTTYHFVIESKDSAGNNVSSRELNFETLSPPDEKKPSLSLHLPDKLSGKALISADAKDNIGVDAVLFYLDGRLMHTDYTFPFEWECDTTGLGDGAHNVDVQTFDFAGNLNKQTRRIDVQNRFPIDLSPVKVRIVSPTSRSEVYSEVDICAEISHDYDLRISRIEFIVDEEIICPYDFDPPIALIPILSPTFMITCLWDTSDVDAGDHNIRVRVRDEAENWGDASIIVEVVGPPAPSINVNRDVRRINNYFEVTLTLQNNSDFDVTNLTISDTNVRFQCIGNALLRSVDWGDFGAIRCTVVNDQDDYWVSTLQASLGLLQRGRTKVLKYYVVPILVPS